MKSSGGSGSERVTGRVKWFAVEKGFGFIALDEDTRDAFFHVSHVDDEVGSGLALVKQPRVSCVVVETAKGLAARQVRIIIEAEEQEDDEQ